MDVEPVATTTTTIHDYSMTHVVPSPLRSTRSVHDLPTELLERILQLSVPPHAPRPYLIRHTVKLRRVCKYWQRIIDGCPILWSEVTFEGGLNLLSKSLTNSKDAALTVKCSLGLGSPARDDKSMRMVLEHAKRWKSLDITLWIKSNRDVSAYLPLREGAPILSDFKMYNTAITTETASLISADKFPRLTSLQLVDVTLGGGFGSLPRLEELSLIDVRGVEGGRSDAVTTALPILKLREVLTSCSGSLKSLKLHGEFQSIDHTEDSLRPSTDEERETELEPITLPNLQKLGIFHCKGETAFRILKVIEASKCKGLKVYSEELSSYPNPSFSLPGWMLGRRNHDENEDEGDSSSSSAGSWTATVSHVIQKLDRSSVLEFELQENGFSVRSSNNGTTAADPPSVEIVIRPRPSDNESNDQSTQAGFNPPPQYYLGDPPFTPSTSSSPSTDLPPWASSYHRRHHHRHHNALLLVLKHLVFQSLRTDATHFWAVDEDGKEKEVASKRMLHVDTMLKYKDGKEPSWGKDFLEVLALSSCYSLGEGLETERRERGEKV